MVLYYGQKANAPEKEDAWIFIKCFKLFGISHSVKHSLDYVYMFG